MRIVALVQGDTSNGNLMTEILLDTTLHVTFASMLPDHMLLCSVCFEKELGASALTLLKKAPYF